MIVAKDIKKSYNGEPCLRGVCMDVVEGDFVAIMGESGSGKTTLLEILAAVREPDLGEVKLLGQNLFALSPTELARIRRTQLGVVYQSFGLVSTLTAGDNIRLPLALEGIDGQEISARVKAIAEKLHIEGLLDKYPEELSGGQQQRVAIARATVYKPKLLLLDEPTGSLDRENAKAVMQYLAELNEKDNTTVVMITHSARCSEWAKRVLVMSDGELNK